MSKKLVILIIEDNPRDAKWLQELLLDSKLSLDILKAETLTEVIDILDHHHLDIILLDLDLVNDQGFKVFNVINRLNLNIPIILLTDLTSEQIALSIIGKGAQDYLIKKTLQTPMLIRAIYYAIEHMENKILQEKTFLLRQSNQAKTTFLANMSHELRSPLNSIIGFTELMYKEKIGTINTPAQKECLAEIAVNAHHLLNLINDILDLSRIESGKIEFHPAHCDLTKIVYEVVNAFSIPISEKKIILVTEIDPALNINVILDIEKFKQILFNYLSNAIKFTPEGGKISVRITLETENYFRLEVSDTGVGISKDNLEKIFNVFGQLDISYSKPHQGVGLGLTVTRQITEALGGRVGVHSQPGVGSTFFSILPLIRSSVKLGSVKEGGKHDL